MKRPPQTHATATGFGWESAGPEEMVYRAVRAGDIRIDAFGAIWRVRRRGTLGGRSGGRLLTPRRIGLSANGSNPAPLVSAAVSGRTCVCTAARLVWMHMHGPIPAGLRIMHLDGNPRNTRPENLIALGAGEIRRRVVERNPDSVARGERAGNCKLDEQRVREIRRLAAAGHRHKDISERYGVTRAAISFAVRGDTWGHVGDEAEFTAEDAEARRKARTERQAPCLRAGLMKAGGGA